MMLSNNKIKTWFLFKKTKNSEQNTIKFRRCLSPVRKDCLIERDSRLCHKTVNKRNANKITTSLEESRDDNVERSVAYTAEVENFVFDGKPVTVKDIKFVYENVHLAFIKKQLNERLESYSNFLDG